MAKVFDKKEIHEWVAKYLWYGELGELLEDKNKLLLFAMARTPEDDLTPLEKYYTKKDFIEALQKAHPGIFVSKARWNHWNERLGIIPPLPLPQYAILNSPNQ